MSRRIYAYRCTKCGTVHYPFRMRCKQCGELEPFQFETVALPTRGTLLTFTHIHNLPAEYEVPRLGVGIVELENGVRVTGQLEIPEPAMGMAVVGEVNVVRKETYDRFWGFVFRAA
jgi:uncharacterized OB-fold protein